MSATIDIPKPEDYDVSNISGFLPNSVPLTRLPSYYDAWENTVAILPALLLSKRLRKIMQGMPVLEIDHLTTVNQQRRAYAILGFLGHAYVWGNGAGSAVDQKAINHLPKCIADPWISVSEKIGLLPIATYAGLCLWNWQFIVPPAHDDSFGAEDSFEDFVDNIRTISTFTGSTDESWFYLVSVFFELRGAPCIPIGLRILQACRDNDVNTVVDGLQELAERIDELGSVLLKMEEMCDPHVFYFKLRPYLAGWKNMADSGLADGVYYGDEKEPRVLSGGSNAQSSLIQFIDLILNVNHSSTGDNANDDTESPFMSTMRQYMPKKHADFLVHLSKVNNLRSFVLENSSDYPELILSYDAAVAMLLAFRDKHIRIVTRYIVIQSAKASKMGSDTTKRAGLATTKKGDSDGELRGTGGTSLLPFLKQCRDETGNAAAGSWGKRILSYKDSSRFTRKK